MTRFYLIILFLKTLDFGWFTRGMIIILMPNSLFSFTQTLIMYDSVWRRWMHCRRHLSNRYPDLTPFEVYAIPWLILLPCFVSPYSITKIWTWHKSDVRKEKKMFLKFLAVFVWLYSIVVLVRFFLSRFR